MAVWGLRKAAVYEPLYCTWRGRNSIKTLTEEALNEQISMAGGLTAEN